jgi:hypothetical protein
MSYKVELEKCKKFGNFLLLPDGSFLEAGEVEAYYKSYYLGIYEVKKIVKNLDKFQEEMKLIESVRNKDIEIAAILGAIIFHQPNSEETAKKLARKYFNEEV